MTHIVVPWGLQTILNDISRSIQARLYYPAMLVALTIPEICSALALDKAIFVKQKHYTDFVDKYTDEAELGVNGLDCYRLRGGVVHRASFSGHDKLGATHVIFTLPETNSILHGITIETDTTNAIMLDLVVFCACMDKAARRWFSDHKNDPKVEENIANLIRLCPQGISPFVVGAPVLASGT